MLGWWSLAPNLSSDITSQMLLTYRAYIQTMTPRIGPWLVYFCSTKNRPLAEVRLVFTDAPAHNRYKPLFGHS